MVQEIIEREEEIFLLFFPSPPPSTSSSLSRSWPLSPVTSGTSCPRGWPTLTDGVMALNSPFALWRSNKRVSERASERVSARAHASVFLVKCFLWRELCVPGCTWGPPTDRGKKKTKKKTSASTGVPPPTYPTWPASLHVVPTLQCVCTYGICNNSDQLFYVYITFSISP